MSKLLPMIVIVGPTAVGKTEAGVKVAKIINGEIVSGDSMQVYKYMDIGTAKPTRAEMDGVPHFMIDIVSPDEDFSVARFQAEVEKYIASIHLKNRMPILVGGTGLYIRSILDHYDFSPPGEDPTIRTNLLNLASEQGNNYLLRMLQKVDPQAVERIHPNDTRRLIRALEVFQTTGRPISEYQYNSEQLPPKYNLAYFGLTMERQRLYEKIDHRVDIMVARGLVDEVMGLLKMGYSVDSTAMQALGYREIIGYLKGCCSLNEAIELIKRNTRRFAKRQLTWFKRDKRIVWLDVEYYNSVEDIANEIVSLAEGQFTNM